MRSSTTSFRSHWLTLVQSGSFFTSSFLMRALERHEKGDARVIPVILRPVDNWQAAPFAKLGAAPTDGRPVTSWPNRDEAFADVAGHIRRAVEELRIPPPGLQKLITNSIGMKLVLIPAGEFLMGSERSAKGRCPANRTAYGVYLVQCYSDPGNRNVGEVNLFMLRLFDESGPVGRADSPRCMLDRIGPFSVRSKAKGL